MTDETRGPALHRDDEVTAHLRGLTAPPADPAYWDGLHARILAHVAEGREDRAWWALSERTYRIGLMAAGLTLIVAGSLWMRARAIETRMAYETQIETPADVQPVFARRGLFDDDRPGAYVAPAPR